jgi:SAM-dependent methyltransferase
MNPSELLEQLGPVDIYLFDQIMKGRFHAGRPLLDAGCGAGRNLHYFLRAGFDVYGVDESPEAVDQTRALAFALAPNLPKDHFRVARLGALPFADGLFGAVLCNAVLHFAPDEDAFIAMLREIWRVLGGGGLLFVRMTSSIGLEDRILPLGHGRYLLPDGSERYLVDERVLLDWTERLGGRLVDPIKTVNVQNRRCMTTWVVHKLSAPAAAG